MWTDILFRLEVWRRRIRRVFTRGGVLRRIFGLEISPGSSPNAPGLLLLQIDGLAYRQLERALSNNRMPFLASLLRREGYRLVSMYSGLPSSTPAVQGELYYGVPCAVPAFGFLDRKRKNLVLMYDDEAALQTEEELRKQGGEPLLKGGSSWMNVFSGGAAVEETHFCAVTFGARQMLNYRSIARLLISVVAHLPSAVRVLVMTAMELVLAVLDMLRAVLAGENLVKEIKFIVSRVIIAAGLREVLTLGATIDLNRGLPIIHVNFLGYDERSHRRAPSSRFAHGELRRIDRAFKRLYHAAEASDRRDYQVWFFSDHGQETVRSVEEERPDGIGEIIHNALRALDVSGLEGCISCGTEWNSSWLGKRRIRKKLEDHEKPDDQSPAAENDFTVVARGPVGHLYFARARGNGEGDRSGCAHQVPPEAWSKGTNVEWNARLARWLVQREGVPGVVYLSGPGEATWVHPKGSVRLPEQAMEFFPHPQNVRLELGRDLVRLCEHPNAGDLVLLGWHPEEPPWTFPLERGAHAGPGQDETQGFAVLPGHAQLPVQPGAVVRPATLRAAAIQATGRAASTATEVLRTVGRMDGAGARTIRLLTYNVHSCIGLDGRLSRARIVRIIRGFDPDIVALQEVDIARKRSGGEDQARLMADDLQMNVEFCTTVSNGRERYGHALMSRLPIESLSCGRLTAVGKRRGEPRGALLARVMMDSAQVYVLNTHLGLTRLERERQVEELLGPSWAGQVPAGMPLVICGDFNMLPRSRAYARMTTEMRDAGAQDGYPTFVSAYPFTRIDYIFVNDRVKIESVRAPRNSLTSVASDHLPLIAELKISDG
jgi:endonuclease/exonuclease/phosphatase family metal-dependent hydrolase